MRHLHTPTYGMFCKRVKPTEYRVDRVPPSETYTTPRADCFANASKQQNARLTVYCRQKPTQPHVRIALQTYESNRIPGLQFIAVRHLHNPTCGMLCTRICERGAKHFLPWDNLQNQGALSNKGEPVGHPYFKRQLASK